MGNFLQTWNDPDIEVDLNWNPEKYTADTVDRLTVAAATALLAEDIPKRLTGASRSEQAADKRLCRQLKTRLTTALQGWGGQPADVTEYAATYFTSLNPEAARVVWPQWWEDWKPSLQRQLHVVATTALKTGKTKDGNRFVNRLLNELNTLGDLFEQDKP